MIPYTQTSLGLEGYCLQTSVECILEAPHGALPAQREFPLGRYHGPLSAFLAKLGLAYDEWRPMPGKLLGWHVMTGPSPRTRKLGTYHSVVGWNGEVVWDPHPRRDGLCGVSSWGLLSRLPVR